MRGPGGTADVLVAVLVASLAAPARGGESPSRLTPPARTGEPPTLVVVAVGLDPRAQASADALAATAADLAAKSGRFTLVSGFDAVNPADRKVREAADRARSLLEEGKKLLDDLDAAQAVKAFSRAVWLRREARVPAAELVEALVLLAAGHAATGENDRARTLIAEAVGLDPAVELSPSLFPPPLIAAGEAVRRSVSGTRTVMVRSQPPGAVVLVDGERRGYAPVEVKGLPPGAHRYEARSITGGPSVVTSDAAEVSIPVKPAERAAQLEAALAPVRRDPAGKGRDEAVRALGQLAAAEQVLLITARSSEDRRLAVSVLRAQGADAHAFAEATGAVSSLSGLTPLLEPVLATDAPRGRDGAPVPSAARSSGSGSSTGRLIASVSLLSLGVLATATGVVFGVMALDRASAFRGTRQTDVGISTQLRTEGQTFALVADISYLVAIAAGVTGGVLLFTQPVAPRPSTSPSRSVAAEPARDGVGAPGEGARAPDGAGGTPGASGGAPAGGAASGATDGAPGEKPGPGEAKPAADEVKKDTPRKRDSRHRDEERRKREREADDHDDLRNYEATRARDRKNSTSG